MLIALTGFMCSGKTTVGEIVADALGCPFLDLDRIIEKKAGCSIRDIFAAGGEDAFRRLEKKALEDTVQKYRETTAVLALGGGTVTVPGAVNLLHDNTLCIYLEASRETLQTRLSTAAQDRPLASGDWQSRLQARRPLYEAAAQVTIGIDEWTPEEIADEIIISCL